MRSHPAAEEKIPLRVLFFEESSEDIELCLWTLRSACFDVTCDAAVTLDEILVLVRTTPYDVILADYRMPSATGMDLFDLMRSEGIDIPFILVTGSLGDEMAVECLKQGVSDYVLKDRLARLPVAIRRAREDARLKAERSRAEEMLRASEASYRSLIQSAPCGVLRLSAEDGRLLDSNMALAVMLGYESPADLLKGSAGASISLAPQVLSSLTEECGEAGRVIEGEVQWRRKDGTDLLIRLAGRLLRDDQGAPTCMEMIAENVTARYRAQNRIQQLNRLYSVLFHAGEVIARTRDSALLFREVCRIIVEEGGFRMAWLGLLETDTGELTLCASCPEKEEYLAGLHVTPGPEPKGQGPIGRSIRENRHVVCNDLSGDPSMAPWRERALRRHFRSVAAFPIAIHDRPIGALSIYAAEVNFFDDENVALLDELTADLSFALEGIETERMRQRLSDELDQFFALSLDMLCISDLRGYIQRLNPAWEKTLGFSAAEMCSRPWVDCVHPDDRQAALDAVAGFDKGVELTHLELRFLAKDGSYKWLVGSATPALDRGLVFAAVSDVTERKVLEEQLRSQNLQLEQQNRNIEAASRMKTEFLANMSHELRSPLNGIIGFTELLYDGKLGGLSERPREFVGRIHASASHLLKLINGVLDLSKIEAGHLEFHPERLFVSQVIREVTGILSGLAAEKQIQFETEIDAAVDEVVIDAGRFRQVLYNYLSNALKFTGENGRIVVRLKSESDTEFRLEVSDTGIGISEPDIARLFVEFQQLDATTAKRYQGTGLGLALTKRIVEAQGGHVGVDSTPGVGSTFFAILPRVASKAPVHYDVARILVVDDQALDRALIARILQSNGYLVETVTTSHEAYEKCQREGFDAITLDMLLPDSPGWELLAKIRSLEDHRNTPVIVISSCDRADLGIPVNVESYLTKPVRPDELTGTLIRVGVPKRIKKVTNE
ncbi:MAG TPA: response regulator [Bryobacteraceae bacterium]|nr:response regulator [Bryobacteraceae bacterium]